MTDTEKKEDLTIQAQLDLQQEALVQIYASVEKTRKYILWTGIMNAVLFILPLIVAAVMLPRIIGTFTTSLDGLTNSTQLVDSIGLEESLERLKELGFE